MEGRTRKTALITGASSGIGYELTKLFAENNYDLVLVALEGDKLQQVGEEMKKQYNVSRLHLITKDLSVPNAAREVYEETQKLGWEINVLVNDAGFGEYGKFVDTNLDKELALIRLNISSLVYLTKMYLREMVARNEGKILQLASIASFHPEPYLAVYAASKAFVLNFTEAVIEEIRDTRVTMTALVPGATDTDFFNKAGAQNSKVVQGKMSDPAEVAREGFDALMAGEARAVAGIKNEMIVGLSNVLPDETMAKLMKKQIEPVKK